ncbi:hypothetical protein CIW49_05015 [Mycolicibacterium sp. P1-18]|uniref:hypothetical protein n=1 Tax=Mycolicibacterium sp. P1-18 TaxID=2024615 RepID=UPI0011F29D5F|nr:hypothetical protein [Mycolicibacterium sp. P1-18]KAA0100903.1 hypothetical protein CIW49_05015 [Mycolicibacterium sp. P1-18]
MSPGHDEDLDRLYGVDPAEFTALRKELVAAAKKRGDREGARAIGAARRPTTAAWVVNALVRADGTATERLAAIGERLRAAHAAMDGAKIREASAAQRALVDELVRTGFSAADVANPSVALRDDVVGTLQAAVADPTVAAQLGRLEKAERWSGFGEFGTVTAVVPTPRPKATAPKKASPTPKSPTGPDEREVAAARKRVASAQHDARVAEQAKAAADEALADRAAAVATARRRYEKVLETVSAAERALSDADADHVDAQQVSQAADDALQAASAALREADEGLQRLADSTDNSS